MQLILTIWFEILSDNELFSSIRSFQEGSLLFLKIFVRRMNKQRMLTLRSYIYRFFYGIPFISIVSGETVDLNF